MPALLCRMSRRPYFETAVFEHLSRVVELGDVRLHKDGAAAGALDSFDGFCAARFVEVGDYYRGAFFRESLRRCTPDSR